MADVAFDEASTTSCQPLSPFAGLTVLDVSQGIAGPYCGTILSQQGATVYKVEPPAGDWGRAVGASTQGMSALSTSANGGKLAVCIDASNPSGVALMTRLAKQADIVIESFRPGVAARVGLDAAVLQKARPDQIILSVSGFGEHGPGAKRPGSDTVLQAMSGMMHLNATNDGIPRLVPMYLIDMVTALYASQLVSAALLERERSGKGRHLKISLLEAAAALQIVPGLESVLRSSLPAGQPPVPSGVFKTLDGFLRVTSLTQRNFEALCQGLQRTDWLENPDFGTSQARLANADRLNAAVADILSQKTAKQWLDTLEPLGVLCATVNDYAAFREDPQVKSMGIFVDVEQPGLGTVPMPRHPGLTAAPEPSPTLGQHSKEVLLALGLTETEIEILIDSKVVLMSSVTSEPAK
ncbi:CaiB/BaiF CoA transferase family protein [Orrella daihaiensis]|uniref:CoA transferase n=1 Tax=Orrella daihaiensis TaxID=2782176 RepID=A0ABY4AM97_9BURK|nr:CoA transferase [Orrella daihaiensis]UOD51403.1 CoA transferase [Orrella daihaiensis]